MADDVPVDEPATEGHSIDIRELGIDEKGVETDLGLVDLVIGGLLEGNQLLLRWLDAEGRHHSMVTTGEENVDKVANHQVKHAAIGFAFRSARTARRNLRTALRVSEKASNGILSPAMRIFNSRLFSPVRDRFDLLVSRGRQEIEDLVQIGADQEGRNRAMVQDMVSYAIEDVIRYLSNSPALEALIKSQIDMLAIDLPQTTQIDVLVRVLANNYITYLAENPDQVQVLIRSQGDTYLAHLEENPEQVQTLVQGQSAGMIEVITEEVRTFTVTGDSFLELLTRKLFRRSPRFNPPEPPSEIQARAPYARLEGDFPTQTGNKHD